MKKNICEYLNFLTKGDMDTLEKLLTYKYKKFKKFYGLLSKYSETIKELDYDLNTNNSLLTIDIIFNKYADISEIITSLNSERSDDVKISITKVTKKSFRFNLELEE